MSRFTASFRSAAALLGCGLLVAATPSFATGKPITITVPATSLKDDTSRLCMPRTSITKDRKSDLPKVMCHTRGEWADMGVTIKTK